MRSIASSRKDRVLISALGLLLVIFLTSTLIAYHRLTATPTQATPTPIVSPAKNSQDHISILQHTFPIHIGNETEIIEHPGLSLTQAQVLPSDIPKTMTVPKFFDDVYGHFYQGGSIRAFLGNHGQELITPEQASKVGSFVDDRETIYCSIASYRDYECRATLTDIFERAAHPERLRVAVLDQIVPGDQVCADPPQPCSQDPEQSLCKYRHLIDYYRMDARLGVGPVFARHLAHRHYRGEYFSMQIDSHVRFIQNWDNLIIEQWKSADNEMAVLTAYLSDIHGRIDPFTHGSLSNYRPIMCKSDYEGTGADKHLRHGQQPEGPPGIHGEPTLEPFWAAGFSFARGHFVIQVPYDQYLPMVFQGEEISIGLRGFTYGYDYYTPEQAVCYHIYALKDNEEKRHKVPLFWENGRNFKGAGLAAMKRLNTIIGVAHFPENEWPQQDKEKYGLGKVRSPEKFYRTFGIHTETQTVEDHLCKFVGKPMMKLFKPALRSNRMGIDYDQISFEFKDQWPDLKKGEIHFKQ